MFPETVETDALVLRQRSPEPVDPFAFSDLFGVRTDGVPRNWTAVGDEVLAHHRYTVTTPEYERATND